MRKMNVTDNNNSNIINNNNSVFNSCLHFLTALFRIKLFSTVFHSLFQNNPYGKISKKTLKKPVKINIESNTQNSSNIESNTQNALSIGCEFGQE